MKRQLATLIIYPFLLFPILLLGQYTDPYPPGSTPDRIVLTLTEDPARSMSVTWRTDVAVRGAFAEIALADPSPDFFFVKDTVLAVSQLQITNRNAAYFHTVTFEGLAPNTQYIYRVGDPYQKSEWIQFKTAGGKDEPFSFLYFGDAQNNLKAMWSRLIRQAYTTAPDIDFLLHAGDLVNIPSRDEEWGEWFYAGGWIYGMKPNIACPGNHEYIGRHTEDPILAPLWRSTFEFPLNGPEEFPETVYYVDYQDARIISLDTQGMKSGKDKTKALVKWLEKVLEKNKQKWTIVTQHHPIYSTKAGRDNLEIRKALQPLFEEYGVDIVLQGHDHSYGRGHNLDYGKKHKDLGPMYVVSVSGPKMYDIYYDEWLERTASNTQTFPTC